MRLGRFSCGALAVGLALLLAGCSHFSQPSIKLHTLTLDVVPGANADTPIAIDVVVVKDPDLLKRLLSLPAKQWFVQREQLRRDYLQAIQVWSLELVPGQFMEARDLPMTGSRAIGLLLYAGYNNPGTNRLRLDQKQQTAWLRFESKSMRMLDSPAGK